MLFAEMPNVEQAINNSNLTGRDLEIAKKIIGRKGLLKSTKPSKDGEAAYVWRMVAFMISSKPAHQCLPITATFDINIVDSNGKWDCKAVDVRAKELDKIVDAIVDNIPKQEWHGINRWSKVLR